MIEAEQDVFDPEPQIGCSDLAGTGRGQDMNAVLVGESRSV